MGSLQAREMADRLDLDQALIWHLQYNHYPPVDIAFLDITKEAIEKANEEEWDTELTMPNGIVKTVAGIIEGLHLDSFLDYNVEVE